MLTVATISFAQPGKDREVKNILGIDEQQAADKAMSFLKDVGVPLRAQDGSVGVLDALLRLKMVQLVHGSAEVEIYLEPLTNSQDFDNRIITGTGDMPEPFVDPAASVYLYILMRSDMESLNPGKAVAQGTHAANQMVYEARKKDDQALNELLAEWEGETGKGFGTCIVLSVDNAEMHQLVDRAVLEGIHSAVTHDPEYPLRDGRTMHFIPVDTCAYIFARKLSVSNVVGHLSLMA